MNRKQQALTVPLKQRLTTSVRRQRMTLIPLPDAMSLLQAAGALCLIALIARRRAARAQDWEGALGKLSGRVREDELG